MSVETGLLNGDCQTTTTTTFINTILVEEKNREKKNIDDKIRNL